MDPCEENDGANVDDGNIYWPLDLLPSSCPISRILTWGYRTLVVDGKPLRVQKDVFSHARDLFVELVRLREATTSSHRPLIFIAHSTGGIIVKEVSFL
jgi:hypothetical protein